MKAREKGGNVLCVLMACVLLFVGICFDNTASAASVSAAGERNLPRGSRALLDRARLDGPDICTEEMTGLRGDTVSLQRYLRRPDRKTGIKSPAAGPEQTSARVLACAVFRAGRIVFVPDYFHASAFQDYIHSKDGKK